MEAGSGDPQSSDKAPALGVQGLGVGRAGPLKGKRNQYHNIV